MLNLNNSKPALHVDPFKKDKVTSISLYYSRVLFSNKYSWVGRIEFENKDTSGKQKFEEESLPDILSKMQQFLDSL